ncbi:MAG: mevalonate kinase [Chloroflexota bacterium]
MPAINTSAPGKVILFGEHAVVYGQPAIAAPVHEVKAKVSVTPNPKGMAGAVRLVAKDVDVDALLPELDPAHPLAVALQAVCVHLGVKDLPACTVKVTSSIPLAAGLGSGAAVSVAVVRAMAAFLGRPLSDNEVSALAYEVEKVHHGTPSGIDNAVIAHAQALYFVKDRPFEKLHPKKPITLAIADTGISSPTRQAVGDVRKAWQADKKKYEAYFESVGSIVDSARQAIEAGSLEQLGALMDANHGLLRKIGVSCPALDALAAGARQAGAFGAKLSGGGRGGNLIALVDQERVDAVARAMIAAGAVRVIVTDIKK